MRFDILTIFPELLTPWREASLLRKAQHQELLEIVIHDIRDFADDKHKTVDDTPYGGGAGMVMKIEPIDRALTAITTSPPTLSSREERGDRAGGGVGEVKRRVVVLSARGQQFDQRRAEHYAQLDQLILICGRYEGIDQRVADYLADEEISIGPYVLNGGEAAALVVLEAVARLVPGVIGNPESLSEESFVLPSDSPAGGEGGDTKEYPQYTKPAEYKGWKVPEVLLSGNHEEIKRWRDEHRKS